MSAAIRSVFSSYDFIMKYGMLMFTAYLYIVRKIQIYLKLVLSFSTFFLVAKGNLTFFLLMFVKYFIYLFIKFYNFSKFYFKK